MSALKWLLEVRYFTLVVELPALTSRWTGWLVQFLVSVRHGDPKKVGYVASGFWSGFTLGRVVLADITHKFGERRMIFVYIALAIVLQLMFWLIPSIPVNAVTVCLLGMLSNGNK